MSHHSKNTSAIYRELEKLLRLGSHSGKSDLEDVVLICIDCEAYEDDQSLITEVGVAILDTATLPSSVNTDGQTGEEPHNDVSANVLVSTLFGKVKYAHYRLIEYRRLVNRKYVKGCEEGFLFGPTVWISRNDVREVLTRIFQDPSRIVDAANFDKDAFINRNRDIVVIGHGLRNDGVYMNSLGFHPSAVANVIRKVDTQVLAGSTKKAQIGLKRMLQGLKIPMQNAHNAGNDAVFTMQGLLRMVVLESQQRGSVVKELQKPIGTHGAATLHSDICAPHFYGGTSRDVTEEQILPGPDVYRKIPALAASMVSSNNCLETQQNKRKLKYDLPSSSGIGTQTWNKRIKMDSDQDHQSSA